MQATWACGLTHVKKEAKELFVAVSAAAIAESIHAMLAHRF